MLQTNDSNSRLNQWLKRHGLRRNPFGARNSEGDSDLPGYFVDVEHFDDLLRSEQPCIVFARRGCGKTAHRQMLAAQCLPTNASSDRLAVHYTYPGFEHTLASVEDGLTRLRPISHVAAILHQGLLALTSAARQAPAVQAALRSPELAPRLAAFQGKFAPHLLAGASEPVVLAGLPASELLDAFATLIRECGLQRMLVLVDGLDEFPLTARRPERMVTFLAHLLGTLPLLERPGVAFRFFLPQDLEPALRMQAWFRPDRMTIFRINWTEAHLRSMIGQRLTFFSDRGDRAYQQLGQLCSPDLAGRIDDELARLAERLPRAALVLADLLLRAHCETPDPAEQIAPETWNEVRSQWATLRADFLEADEAVDPAPKPAASVIPPGAGDARISRPPLTLDAATGRVQLGEREITSEINAQDFQVLACLFKNRGSICSKDLLVKEAWPDAKDGGVSDQAIAASIARLRKNLGHTSPQSGYIETVTGRGYRLHSQGFAAP